MTKSARAAGAALLIALLGAIAVVALAGRQEPATSRAGPRPRLLLITSLPLVFGEEFALEGGSAALDALETRYQVVPINVADRASLDGGSLLLMAHPLAQPAESLVDLDRWVRAGGRLLLLADPALEWPSERPLGDKFRPPPAFADTGLLAHWGLRLQAPDERGPAPRRLGGEMVLTVSPGELSGRCAISADRLVARCALGRGRATVVADADFLDAGRLGSGAERNLAGLLAEFGALGGARIGQAD